MEAASKKIGRPRKHSPKLNEALAAAWGSRAKTERQKQAFLFVQHAADVLVDTRRNTPVKGVEQIFSDTRGRFGVLEQLGRLLDETGCNEKTLIAYAREVNKLFVDDPKMTTRKAENIVRIVRRKCKNQPT